MSYSVCEVLFEPEGLEERPSSLVWLPCEDACFGSTQSGDLGVLHGVPDFEVVFWNSGTGECDGLQLRKVRCIVTYGIATHPCNIADVPMQGPPTVEQGKVV